MSLVIPDLDLLEAGGNPWMELASSYSSPHRHVLTPSHNAPGREAEVTVCDPIMALRHPFLPSCFSAKLSCGGWQPCGTLVLLSVASQLELVCVDSFLPVLDSSPFPLAGVVYHRIRLQNVLWFILSVGMKGVGGMG